MGEVATNDDLPETAAPVAAAFAALADEAGAWLRGGDIAADDAALARAIDLRYPAQAHELTIPVAAAGAVDAEALRRAFHDAHQQLYGFAENESRVQTNTVRLAATVASEPFHWPRVAAGAAAAPAGKRSVYHDGGWHDAAVYDRAVLAAGTVLTGPAVVEQPDTTVWIPPGSHARADALGCLRLGKADRASDSPPS